MIISPTISICAFEFFKDRLRLIKIDTPQIAVYLNSILTLSSSIKKSQEADMTAQNSNRKKLTEIFLLDIILCAAIFDFVIHLNIQPLLNNA